MAPGRAGSVSGAAFLVCTAPRSTEWTKHGKMEALSKWGHSCQCYFSRGGYIRVSRRPRWSYFGGLSIGVLYFRKGSCGIAPFQPAPSRGYVPPSTALLHGRVHTPKKMAMPGEISQTFNDMTVLRGALPREPVCTENLTPLIKMLPCRSKVPGRHFCFMLFQMVDVVDIPFVEPTIFTVCHFPTI